MHSGSMGETETRWPSGAPRQIAVAISASMMAMTNGCWAGWSSPSVKKLLYNETGIYVDHDQVSWIVAASDVGALFSPLPAGYLADILGRKVVLMLSGVLAFIAWLLIGLATTAEYLYVARFLAGIGKGITNTVVPMYLGEIASVEIRGALTTLYGSFHYAGTLFEISIGPYVSFKMLVILSAMIPVLFLCSFLFMPETPYFLLMKGRDEKASTNLRWLRRTPKTINTENDLCNKIEKELHDMRWHAEEESKEETKVSDLLSTFGNRRATLIILLTSAFERLSGMAPLFSYSSTILPPHQGLIGPSQVVIVLGCILTISIFISTALIDRLGRRPLLLISGMGCGIFSFGNAIYYYLDKQTGVEMVSFFWVPYICLLCFGFTHSIGLSIIPHTLTAELFPTNLRSSAAAIASIVCNLCSFLVNKFFMKVNDNVGIYASFIFYTANGFLCFIFIFFCLFETKGKSFAEIQKFLKTSKSFTDIKY